MNRSTRNALVAVLTIVVLLALAVVLGALLASAASARVAFDPEALLWASLVLTGVGIGGLISRR